MPVVIGNKVPVMKSLKFRGRNGHLQHFLLKVFYVKYELISTAMIKYKALQAAVFIQDVMRLL